MNGDESSGSGSTSDAESAWQTPKSQKEDPSHAVNIAVVRLSGYACESDKPVFVTAAFVSE